MSDKITTDVCKDYIVKEFSEKCSVPSYTERKNWSRKSKRGNNKDGFIREFINKDDPSILVSLFSSEEALTGIKIEKDNQLMVFTEATKTATPSSPGGGSLLNLKENKITVSFNVKPSEDLSGRVVYSLGDDGFDGYKDDDEGMAFYCGPETKDGALDDGRYTVDTELTKLFSDIPDIDIGAAENYHIVYEIKGVTAKEMWEIIVDRLEKSGAVEMANN